MQNPEQCTHNQTKPRKKKSSNGSLIIRRQCLDCGTMVGQQLKHDTIDLDNVEWVDQHLQRSGESLRRQAWKAKAEQGQRELAKKNNEWWQWYKEYLQSPQWQDKRQRVLQRDRHQCRACERSRATQVHHLTYEHVGNEPLFDLVAVCKSCHDSLTNWKKRHATFVA